MRRLALTGCLVSVVAALTSPVAAEPGHNACPSLAEDTPVRQVIFYDAAKPGRKFEMTVPVPYLGADPAKTLRLGAVNSVPVYMYSPRLFIDHKTLCPGPPINPAEPSFTDKQVGVSPVESLLVREGFDQVENTEQRPDGVVVIHLAKPSPEKTLFAPFGSLPKWSDLKLYTFAGDENVPKFAFRCAQESPHCRLHIYSLEGMTISVPSSRTDIGNLRTLAKAYQELFASFSLKRHKGLAADGYGRWACATLRNDAPAWPIALAQPGQVGVVYPMMVPDDYINLAPSGKRQHVQISDRQPVSWRMRSGITVYVDADTLCPRPRASAIKNLAGGARAVYMGIPLLQLRGHFVRDARKFLIRSEPGPSGIERWHVDVDVINERLVQIGREPLSNAPDTYYFPGDDQTPETLIYCADEHPSCDLHLFYNELIGFEVLTTFDPKYVADWRGVVKRYERLLASFGLGS